MTMRTKHPSAIVLVLLVCAGSGYAEESQLEVFRHGVSPKAKSRIRRRASIGRVGRIGQAVTEIVWQYSPECSAALDQAA